MMRVQLSLENLHMLCLPMVIVTVMLMMNMAKECVQMYQQRLAYFGDAVNLAEWALYVTAGIFIMPMLFFGHLSALQWQCGAVAVFLAWFNLLLYLQRYVGHHLCLNV